MCFFFFFFIQSSLHPSKFHVPFCLIFPHTFLFLRHSVAPWCTSFRSASTMASLDLWALMAKYSSGNHIFEILSFKHRNYVLSSFGVGNSTFLWVRSQVFRFKNTDRAFFLLQIIGREQCFRSSPQISLFGMSAAAITSRYTSSTVLIVA
jgi:hypothetical protein